MESTTISPPACKSPAAESNARIVWDRLMGAYDAAKAADDDINAR